MGRKSKFTAEQISFVLKQMGTGAPMPEVRRKSGVSQQTVDRLPSKHGEMQASEVRRLNDSRRRTR